MFTTLPLVAFPAIDPVAIELGPLVIRWYALAYVAGILLGWRLAMRLAARPGTAVLPREVDDLAAPVLPPCSWNVLRFAK